RVFVGKSVAAASTSDLSPAAMTRLVDEAVSLARITSPDELAGLPDAALLSREIPDLDLRDPRGHDLSPEEKIDLARRCEAAQRALRRLGARRVKTAEVPVVFDPEMAASLVRHIAGAASGPALYRRASFLVGKLGERIASPSVTIVDDGTMPGALGSRPFDGEGLPVRRTVVVDQGVLRSYLLDPYSGRKLGLPSAHPGARDGSGVSVST